MPKTFYEQIFSLKPATMVQLDALEALCLELLNAQNALKRAWSKGGTLDDVADAYDAIVLATECLPTVANTILASKGDA